MQQWSEIESEKKKQTNKSLKIMKSWQ